MRTAVPRVRGSFEVSSARPRSHRDAAKRVAAGEGLRRHRPRYQEEAVPGRDQPVGAKSRQGSGEGSDPTPERPAAICGRGRRPGTVVPTDAVRIINMNRSLRSPRSTHPATPEQDEAATGDALRLTRARPALRRRRRTSEHAADRLIRFCRGAPRSVALDIGSVRRKWLSDGT